MSTSEIDQHTRLELDEQIGDWVREAADSFPGGMYTELPVLSNTIANRVAAITMDELPITPDTEDEAAHAIALLVSEQISSEFSVGIEYTRATDETVLHTCTESTHTAQCVLSINDSTGETVYEIGISPDVTDGCLTVDATTSPE